MGRSGSAAGRRVDSAGGCDDNGPLGLLVPHRVALALGAWLAVFPIAGSNDAHAACQSQGNGILLCTGDVRAGVRESGSNVSRINVRDLTHDIAPANQNGVSIVGGNPTIDADLSGRTITAVGQSTYQGGRAGIGAWGNVVSVRAVNGTIDTTGIYNHGVVGGSTGASSTVFFQGTLSTTGSHSRGIWVNAHAGSATLTADSIISTTGAVNADAIKVEAATGVVLRHTGRSETTGENSEGMYLRATAGAIRATTTASTLITRGLYAGAIEAHARDGVSITQDGTIQTFGIGGRGIYALSDNDAVSVTSSGSIATAAAQSDAIEAKGRGPVNIVSQSAVSTSGLRSEAINAISTHGAVSIASTGAVSTGNHDAAGIIATAAQSATITQNGRLTTAGNRSHGIWATARLDVSITAVSDLSTRGTTSQGIFAHSHTGNATVDYRGQLSVAGNGSRGILALSNAGNASVKTNGVLRGLSNQGRSVVEVTAGNAAHADITGTIISSTIAAPAVTVSGNRGATVKLAGDVYALGTNATAIQASSSGGPVTVEVARGVVRSGPGNGSAITLSGGSSSTTNRVLNSGVVLSASGNAVVGSAFSDLIDNRGTMGGAFQLGGGDDRISNAGTISIFRTSDFGAGADQFINSGLLKVNGAVSLANLEVFDNARGTITMQDGFYTGRLATSGGFSGGGQILVDAQWNRADRIVVAGTVTGRTAVGVDYRPGGSTIPPQGLPLIEVTSGNTSGGNFVLAGGPIVDGMLNYNLRLQPGGTWSLVGSPNASAARLLANTSLGTQAWSQSSSAFGDYVAGFRSAGQSFRGSDGSLQATRFNSDAGGGPVAASGAWMASFGAAGPASDVRADQHQERASGFQGGIDHTLLADADGNARIVAGITFGARHFSSDSAQAANDEQPNQSNVGIYVASVDGATDVSVLAKTDVTSLRYSDTGVAAGDLDLATSGLQFNTGYTLPHLTGPWSLRFDGGTRYMYSQIDNTQFNHIAVSFDASTEFVAFAGATLGFATERRRGSTDGFSASLSVHLEQDLMRRRAIDVAGYGLSDGSLRTMLDVGARLEWQAGGFALGGEMTWRHDLMGTEDGPAAESLEVRLRSTTRW